MKDLLVNSSLLPLLFMAAIGLKKAKLLKLEWAEPLVSIGFNLGLSSLIFVSFLEASVSTEMLLNPIIGFAFAAGLFSIGFFLLKPFGVSREKRAVFVGSVVALEAGAIGYPFYMAIYGMPKLPHIVLLDLGMAVFCFTFLTFYFYRASSSVKTSLFGQLKRMTRNPILLAMGLGLILNLLGLKPNPNSIAGGCLLLLLESFAHLAIPLIVIGVVTRLNLNLVEILHALPFAIINLGLTAGLATLLCALASLFSVSAETKGALLVMSLLPPSLYVYVLTETLELSEHAKSYASRLFSVTMFLSMIVLVIVAPHVPKWANLF